jgi:hypothetical protein
MSSWGLKTPENKTSLMICIFSLLVSPENKHIVGFFLIIKKRQSHLLHSNLEEFGSCNENG